MLSPRSDVLAIAASLIGSLFLFLPSRTHAQQVERRQSPIHAAIEHAMVYDSARRPQVRFGGNTFSNSVSGETWIRGVTCPANFNMDHTTDFFDYLDFVDALSSDSS